MPYQSRNPYTGQTVATFEDIAPKDLAAQLAAAQAAQIDWRTEAMQVRASLLPALAALLRAEVDSLAKLATEEMGKHIREARAEVEKCASLCDYYAELGPAWLADESVKDMQTSQGRPAKGIVAFEPLGVVLAVMPWNFPFWQAFRAAVPALLAGNGMVLKHASNVPGCALAMEDLFLRAGFPDHVFSQIFLPPNRLEEALAHPAIQGLTLTGSEGAGRAAGALAAKHLKKQVLELGGADPFIVLADADVATVAKRAAAARMVNTGQSCIAAKRFIINSGVAPDFLVALTAELSALIFGDPMSEAVSYGPLARPDLAIQLEKKVNDSLAAGARCFLPGGRPKEATKEDAFFTPVILTDIPQNAPAYSEELFGPVASVFMADSDAQAIAIANESTFGLGASIWTADTERGMALARQIQSGSVFINDIMHSDQRVPFGGIKNSGYGRELSAYGLREFLNVKTIVSEG